MAVTRPVKYPSLMTSKKAKLLIAGVWSTSFVICFPPLVGWNDRHQNLAQTDIECVLACELTNDVGYVLYSAMGSFFLPMLVMMFFYYKIYLAAVETTKAINRGFKTTKKGGTGGQNVENEHAVTLRIHVGRNNSLQGQNRSSAAASRSRRFSNVKIPGVKGGKGPPGNTKKSKGSKFHSATRHFDPFEEKPREGMELVSLNSDKSSSAQGSSSCDNGSLASRNRGTLRMGKKNIKVQVKRFKTETKAAKTLGIIVGVFIVCWFPFFTMYLVRAFCVDCIHPLLFSIFFWLGYCNSAINPCIYAMFNKDFRQAFKKILCKVICRKERRKWPLPLPGMYLATALGDDSDDIDDLRA